MAVHRSARKASREVVWCLSPMAVLVSASGPLRSTCWSTTRDSSRQGCSGPCGAGSCSSRPNHLGHFALTLGLHRHLAAAAAAHGGARVVALSSTAHMRAPVDFDDIHFQRRAYDPQTAYAQSKTANSLFAVEVTKRWRNDGIFANAVNPGGRGHRSAAQLLHCPT